MGAAAGRESRHRAAHPEILSQSSWGGGAFPATVPSCCRYRLRLHSSRSSQQVTQSKAEEGVGSPLALLHPQKQSRGSQTGTDPGWPETSPGRRQELRAVSDGAAPSACSSHCCGSERRPSPGALKSPLHDADVMAQCHLQPGEGMCLTFTACSKLSPPLPPRGC